MQIVIDIPDEDYKKICANKEDAIIAHDTWRRIANWGIPLPRGHGDLIDKDQIQQIELWDDFTRLIYRNEFNPLHSVKYALEAPTIVPADKERSSHGTRL